MTTVAIAKQEPDAMFLRSKIADGTYGPWKFELAYNEMGPGFICILKKGKEAHTYLVEAQPFVLAAIKDAEGNLEADR